MENVTSKYKEYNQKSNMDSATLMELHKLVSDLPRLTALKSQFTLHMQLLKQCFHVFDQKFQVQYTDRTKLSHTNFTREQIEFTVSFEVVIPSCDRESGVGKSAFINLCSQLWKAR